jgi:hypothetical protein
LPGGKQRREFVGYTITEAQAADGKLRAKKHEHRIFEMLPRSKMTFNELIDWYGSGDWYRWDSKATVESQKKIDIRLIKKRGHLHPSTSGTLSWGIRGENHNVIGFRVETDRLVLNYFNQQNDGGWEKIKDEIFFTWTPCNYGGNRVWFLCPGCNRRVAIIYGGKYYRCRHCHNLTYSSQRESKPDRLLRKAQNIRERLGVSGNITVPILFKPKNMHQKTFDRLRREAGDAIKLYCKIIWRQRQGVAC